MNRNNKVISHRALKVGEQLRQLISKILINNDFHLGNLANKVITVTDVDISPDLKNAKIFIMFSAEDEGEGKNLSVVDELNKKNRYIKKLISKSLKVRFIPEINFFQDTSLEYSQKIDDILRKLK